MNGGHGYVVRLVKTTLTCGALAFSLGGCSGIKFNDRPDFNVKLSQEMLGASVFTDTEILKRHLGDIPGYVAIADGTGDLQAVAPLQLNGFVPPVTPIKDDAAFYHSVIDDTAGGQGSYLTLLSASLSTKQTAEVTITRIGRAHV